MAEMNCGNGIVVATFASTAFIYSVYHTYMYDGCRCLVPRRKDWFRALLMWMLLLSSLGMLIWAVAWAYVKYTLGWVYMGPAIGARPWPSAMFPEAYKGYNKPLTVIISVAYSLQASLNAEETLFWYHGMRSVRAPHLARAWIGSTPFWVWVAISLGTAGLQIGIPWIAYDPKNIKSQLSLELCVGGIIEGLVVLMATVIIWRFPKFMDEVKASGAGPEVRARLHFYHEANKVRTFFRYLFTAALVIIGADGLTPNAPINMRPLAADCLVTTIAGTFCIVIVVSVIVYLPRTYGVQHGRVMVGAPQRPASHGHVACGDGEAQGGQHTGHFALVTLLREGGQLGHEDDYEYGHGYGYGREGEVAYEGAGEGEGKRLRDSGAPPGSGFGSSAALGDAADGGVGVGGAERDGAGVFGNKEAAASADWSLAKETREEDWSERPVLPAALQHFTSPIVPHIETSRPAGPVQVRVHVERQVHED